MDDGGVLVQPEMPWTDAEKADPFRDLRAFQNVFMYRFGSEVESIGMSGEIERLIFQTKAYEVGVRILSQSRGVPYIPVDLALTQICGMTVERRQDLPRGIIRLTSYEKCGTRFTLDVLVIQPYPRRL